MIAKLVVCEQLTFTLIHAQVEEVDRSHSTWAVAHALLSPWSCTRQDGILTQVLFAVVALCPVHVTPLSAVVMSAVVLAVHAQQPWIAAWAHARYP